METVTTTSVYSVWCEYDLGLAGYVYTSEDYALAAARAAFEDLSDDETFDELLEGGLVGVDTLTLISA